MQHDSRGCTTTSLCMPGKWLGATHEYYGDNDRYTRQCDIQPLGNPYVYVNNSDLVTLSMCDIVYMYSREYLTNTIL